MKVQTYQVSLYDGSKPAGKQHSVVDVQIDLNRESGIFTAEFLGKGYAGTDLRSLRRSIEDAGVFGYQWEPWIVVELSGSEEIDVDEDPGEQITRHYFRVVKVQMAKGPDGTRYMLRPKGAPYAYKPERRDREMLVPYTDETWKTIADCQSAICGVVKHIISRVRELPGVEIPPTEE